MNKKLAISLGVSVLLASFMVSAAEVTHDGTVSRIYADDNGTVNVQLKDIDFGECDTVKTNHYYSLLDSHPRFDELYALILAAAYEQKQITVRIDESTCDGTVLDNSSITRITQNF